MKKCRSCQTEIDSKASKCPHCQADLRNWFAKHKVLTVILVLISIGIISNSGNKGVSSSNNTTSNNEPTKNVEIKPKSFVKVIEVGGNQNKKSDSFNLEGGKQKITYNFQGGEMIIGGIYLMKEGTSKEKEGGIPEVMVQNTGTDSTIARKSAGTYYLDVTSANAKWTVTIEEER